LRRRLREKRKNEKDRGPRTVVLGLQGQYKSSPSWVTEKEQSWREKGTQERVLSRG
jgi:hypothetical protein